MMNFFTIKAKQSRYFPVTLTAQNILKQSARYAIPAKPFHITSKISNLTAYLRGWLLDYERGVAHVRI